MLLVVQQRGVTEVLCSSGIIGKQVQKKKRFNEEQSCSFWPIIAPFPQFLYIIYETMQLLSCSIQNSLSLQEEAHELSEPVEEQFSLRKCLGGAAANKMCAT